jgi:transposase
VSALSPYAKTLQGIVVESTFNWYWLVDGLMEAGFRVHLANTARMQEYGGLKYTDDHHDARWLAHMLRLGILPEGYIYPAEERAVRDLLRKRGQLVRQRTAQILSIQNLVSRNLGVQLSGNRIKQLDGQGLSELLTLPEQQLAAGANLSVMQQEEGREQPQERQQVFGLGVRGGGQLRHPLPRSGQALLPAQEGQDQRGGGDQGSGPQARAGQLLRHARPGGLRYR